jgi:leishmanolysin-like peptidase
MEESKPLGFEPIRMSFETSTAQQFLEASINRDSPLLATKTYLLLYHVLPRSAEILSDVIRVVPVQGSLYPLSLAPQPSYKQYYCPDSTTAGLPGGADLFIYVTLDRFYCGETEGGNDAFSTAASSRSCERDQFDRPVTGSIDFCLDAFPTVTPIEGLRDIIASMNMNATIPVDGTVLDSNNQVVVNRMVEIATHEFLHVLGFSSDSLPFFRNAITGEPYTSRPFQLKEVLCAGGDIFTLYGEPDERVLGRGQDAITGEAFFEVRTPLVTQVVRNHFNCPSMTGARLENEDTSTDCFGSHWSERHYYSELMSAYLLSTSTNAFSPLTLSFLEDSSWYRANYQSEYVRTPSYGRHAGCDFLEKPCIVGGLVPSYGQGNFCNNTMELTKEGYVLRQALPQTCDPSYTYKAHCDLRDIKDGEDVPGLAKKYFGSSSPKVPYEFTKADYCPIPSQQPTNCLNPGDQFIVSKEYLDAREKNGPSSKCVDVITRDRAICLESICNANIGRLQLIVLYGLKITCQYDGEIHTLLGSKESPNGEPFQIRCPRLSQACPELVCPDNCSGRGVCNIDNERKIGYCDCFDQTDNTTGCYLSSLRTVYRQESFDEVGTEKKAKVGVFLFAVLFVVLSLVGLHVCTRLRNERKRRGEDSIEISTECSGDDQPKGGIEKLVV